MFARVGAKEKRRLAPGPDGIQVLALGGVPGKAFQAAEWTEAGAPAPGSDG